VHGSGAATERLPPRHRATPGPSLGLRSTYARVRTCAQNPDLVPPADPTTVEQDGGGRWRPPPPASAHRTASASERASEPPFPRGWGTCPASHLLACAARTRGSERARRTPIWPPRQTQQQLNRMGGRWRPPPPASAHRTASACERASERASHPSPGVGAHARLPKPAPCPVTAPQGDTHPC
jgi:hypothetical protein